MTQSDSMITQKEFKPRRPWLIYIIALCFLLSPFVNLASALYVGGHPHWYDPTVWFSLFLRLTLLEQLLMFAGECVALLLFLQQKRSWFCALVLVILITAFNLFAGSQVSQVGFQILSAVNFIATLSVLAILLFFRYPYLDQRDSIYSGQAKRFEVKIPVFIEGHGPCEIINISKTGCKIFAENPNPDWKPGGVVVLKMTDEIKVECDIMHTKTGFGLMFKKLSKPAKNQIKKWLKPTEKIRATI